MHGRAGRENLPGKVIIQSYNPENFAIQCAKKQNYEKFYETEIALRKQLKYPPFCDIILVNFNSLSKKEIKDISLWFYNCLENKLDKEKFKVFMPIPSPIDKIQNRYRYRIIIKGIVDEKANEILNDTLKQFYEKNLKTTRITIDINPNNMI